MQEWSEDDILDTRFELKKEKVWIYYRPIASDTFYTLYLTIEAIAVFEQQFRESTLKERIVSVLDIAAEIKAVIPFA